MHLLLATVELGDLAGAAVLTIGAAIPLALSVWALLDIAHRPSWAWALSGRTQVTWLAAVLFGTLLLVVGVGISAWYLLVVRREIAAAERGELGPQAT